MKLNNNKKKYIYKNNLYSNSIVQDYTFVFKRHVINF